MPGRATPSGPASTRWHRPRHRERLDSGPGDWGGLGCLRAASAARGGAGEPVLATPPAPVTSPLAPSQEIPASIVPRPQGPPGSLMPPDAVRRPHPRSRPARAVLAPRPAPGRARARRPRSWWWWSPRARRPRSWWWWSPCRARCGLRKHLGCTAGTVSCCRTWRRDQAAARPRSRGRRLRRLNVWSTPAVNLRCPPQFPPSASCQPLRAVLMMPMC